MSCTYLHDSGGFWPKSSPMPIPTDLRIRGGGLNSLLDYWCCLAERRESQEQDDGRRGETH